MKEIIGKLLSEGGALRVRSILAFTVTGVFAYLAVDGQVSADVVKEVVVIVLGFYFITRAAQGGNGGNGS